MLLEEVATMSRRFRQPAVVNQFADSLQVLGESNLSHGLYALLENVPWSSPMVSTQGRILPGNTLPYGIIVPSRQGFQIEARAIDG
jgi:hypothetical protein